MRACKRHFNIIVIITQANAGFRQTFTAKNITKIYATYSGEKLRTQFQEEEEAKRSKATYQFFLPLFLG